MMFSENMVQKLESSSWIRVMFEEGNRLAKIYGADKVYDYSLGNPFDEPPAEVQESLLKHITSGEPGLHKYMSNSGYGDVRAKIAKKLQEESTVSISDNNIVMTVGAAGGLNVVLKSLLNEGEEVMVFAPYFVDYGSYVSNFGGKTVVVPANTETFEPNIEEFEKRINAKTKAIILNTPNNPTGVVYSEEILKRIEEILQKKGKEFNTTIYVISDEPYSKIVYDDIKVPSIISIFQNAIVVDSFSKSLGLAGERIGYIAASSNIEDISTLVNVFIYCTRVLGFVNAPALFQKVVGDCLYVKPNVKDYKAKRDFLYENLVRIGFKVNKPQGAFYLFPKALISNDIEFTQAATKHNLLLVPGSGFGCPGYFRMSYCVNFDMIRNSIPAFERLAEDFK